MNELIFIAPYLFSIFPIIEEYIIQGVHEVISSFLENE